MLEFILIGRGGQGVVLAEEILAEALFYQDFHVKSFPAFGTERRGAPVRAFLRVSKDLIRENCQIYNPNYYIIFDQTQIKKLPEHINGLVNAKKEDSVKSLVPIDAGNIALKYNLGTETNPIINTTLLGATAALLDTLEFDNLKKAIQSKLPEYLWEQNIKAAFEAYQLICNHQKIHWSLKCA